MKHRRKYSIIMASIALLLVAAWWLWPLDRPTETSVRVQRGSFTMSLQVPGELAATKSVDILSPHARFEIGTYIMPLEVLELVPEGTLVKKGDKVAVLNPSPLHEQLSNIDLFVFNLQQNIENARLDSALALSEARNQIVHQKEQVAEAEFKLEQSVYESKSMQRQAQMEVDMARRNLNNQLRNYQRSQRQFATKIARDEGYMLERSKEAAMYAKLIENLVVTAPSDGMVVHGRLYRNQKVKVGSRVNRWTPIIATLPDVRYMESVMQVKEIDINKVKVGQSVSIRVDAFPDTRFTGTITKVANLGQPASSPYDIVFEVHAAIETIADRQLLPGMTAYNTIVTGHWDNALFIDKKAVFSNDTCQFVYLPKGLSMVKQQVLVDGENDTFYRLTAGLSEDTKVLLNEPDNHEDIELSPVK